MAAVHNNQKLEKYLDYFFHLPTLITIALVGIALVWQLYDIGFTVGDGFARLNTNRGKVSIYWINGCCDIDF